MSEKRRRMRSGRGSGRYSELMRALELTLIASMSALLLGCPAPVQVEGGGSDESGDSSTGSQPMMTPTSSSDGDTGTGAMEADGTTAGSSDEGTTAGPTTSDDGDTTADSGDSGETTAATGDSGGTTDTGATGETDATTTDDPSTSGSTGDTDGMTSAGTDTGESSGDTGDPPCSITMCDGFLYECGDCVDNDGDGSVDEFDVECISPCDDDEGSFATGIPGDNVDFCNQDCFFDGDSGSGNDGCNWNVGCDPLDPGMGTCQVPPSKDCMAPQPEECLENCNVPNGCDCFGCCAVDVDGMTINILIGADDCSIAQIENCPLCTPQESCTNPCDPTDCELCFGEKMLPPECDMPACPEGVTPCESNDDCSEVKFCQTGCCVTP